MRNWTYNRKKYIYIYKVVIFIILFNKEFSRNKFNIFLGEVYLFIYLYFFPN